jgi:hypothetical protein
VRCVLSLAQPLQGHLPHIERGADSLVAADLVEIGELLHNGMRRDDADGSVWGFVIEAGWFPAADDLNRGLGTVLWRGARWCRAGRSPPCRAGATLWASRCFLFSSSRSNAIPLVARLHCIATYIRSELVLARLACSSDEVLPPLINPVVVFSRTGYLVVEWGEIQATAVEVDRVHDSSALRSRYVATHACCYLEARNCFPDESG